MTNTTMTEQERIDAEMQRARPVGEWVLVRHVKKKRFAGEGGRIFVPEMPGEDERQAGMADFGGRLPLARVVAAAEGSRFAGMRGRFVVVDVTGGVGGRPGGWAFYQEGEVLGVVEG